MDESLEKALDFSNYMVTFNNQKRIIYEEYMADLIVYQGGGKFSVNKELISFIANLIDQSNTKTVLVDDNQTPVLIEDLPSFMHDVKVCYSTASTKYYEKYKKMVSKRNVESLVDV
tara:strand:+ start:564 stop:911 length:348 start_codon:yes stop_codon:yes gene_type:complete